MPRQLSPNFIAHVARIRAILDEVEPKSMDDWIEGFALDGKPAQELFVWECIANTYHVVTHERELTLEAKRDAFMLAFHCSFGDAHAEQKAADCKHLDADVAAEVLAQYRAAAAANSMLWDAAIESRDESKP
jgi:hypothetical protein